jgi:class 3 adenylate cyclase/tetratricopeptide (TPR) repeat protein
MDTRLCARCQHANALNSRFCAQCGAAFGLACRQCGAALAAGQRFCGSCGAKATTTAPEPSADVDEGERRHATVLFSDLSGYTALNERLDPEDVERIVARIRTEAIAVVEANGGIVNQFVGDEVMSLFGVPHAGRDDAVRAVRAALALHEAVRSITAESGDALPLTLHSGINSGLVIVRPSAQHDGRFALTGDTVNTAARLLKLAGANDIVVSADTWRAVSDHFDSEALPPTAVKGKQFPLQPYRIVHERVQREASPLVGRDEEMALAMFSVHACVERGSARLVVVRGEPGIGKSRLLHELLRRARAASFDSRVAQVLDFGPARGRGALRSLCTQLLGGAGTAHAEERSLLLAKALEQRRVEPAHEPFLRALLDVALPDAHRAAMASMDAAARERGELGALVALVRGHCSERPLALALEDTHWAEPTALSLWCQLVGACAALPVLFVATTRPEVELIDAARRTRLAGVNAVTIDLGPLPRDAARAMVQRFKASTEDWVEACIERAAGNPLFLEQLLVNAGEAARAQVPGSIQALVLARVDRLPAAAKAALQAAAVLGFRFDPAALPALLGADAAELEPLLAVGLLRPVEGDMQFVHALVRDGVYESLLKSRRRDLHTRAAAWFATREPGMQAEHLDRADSPLASEAYLAAATLEAARWQHERALVLAGRGLQLAKSAAHRYALALLMGEQLREVGRNREALAQFETARDLAEGDAETFRAWFEIAGVKRYLAEVDGALRALQAADAVLERWGGDRERSRVAHLRGNLHFAAGRSAECEAEHRRALTHARAVGDALCEAQALSGLGDAAYAAGDMVGASRSFTSCVEVCDREGLLRYAIMNRGMIAICAYFNGQLPLAMRLLPLANEEAKRLGHVNAQVMIEETIGICLNMLGHYEEALKVNSGAIDLARSVGSRRYEVVASGQLAHTLRMLGREAEGLAMVERAWELVEAIGAHGFAGPMVLSEWAACSRGSKRDELLARGEAVLAKGALAHTHLWFWVEAITLRLQEERVDEVDRFIDALQRWTFNGSVAWAEHHVQAARALARCVRKERSPELRQELERLQRWAEELAYGESQTRLTAALQTL